MKGFHSNNEGFRSNPTAAISTQAAAGLETGPILGIVFGAIVAVVIVVLCVVCTCICFKMLRRRKKMMRLSQVS